MYIYAILNENMICTGMSQLSGEVIQENMIKIPAFSDEYVWRKYENAEWSTEKFEPQSTAPLTAFDQLIKNQESMTNTQAQVVLALVMGGLM